MEEIPTQLPRADEAVIEPEKLTEYALNPDHSKGANKARVFRSALGIGRDEWEYLCDQLLEGVKTAHAVRIDLTPWGTNYTVPVRVDGLNGRSEIVVSAWEVRSDEAPRLITAYVEGLG